MAEAPNEKPSPDYRLLAVVTLIILVLDQATKALVLQQIPLHGSIPVISGFFNLTHIHNPGGAFGFLADQSIGVRRLFFLIISSAAVVLVFWFYRTTPRDRPFLALAFALIFGGAIGNLIDRFRFGKVVDFLDFYLGQWHWPAFNVADSAITVGIGIFLLHLLSGKMPD
ncbi:MAG: signal peptidase II [Desulfobacterales bacterium]